MTVALSSLLNSNKKLFLQNITFNLNSLEEKKFTVKDAIFLIKQSWDLVSQSTIINCWKKAGILHNSSVNAIEFDIKETEDNYDKMEIFYLIKTIAPGCTVSVDEYLEIEDNLQ